MKNSTITLHNISLDQKEKEKQNEKKKERKRNRSKTSFLVKEVADFFFFKGDLVGLDEKLYNYITQHFLGTIMSDSKYTLTSTTVQFGNEVRKGKRKGGKERKGRGKRKKRSNKEKRNETEDKIE